MINARDWGLTSATSAFISGLGRRGCWPISLLGPAEIASAMLVARGGGLLSLTLLTQPEKIIIGRGVRADGCCEYAARSRDLDGVDACVWVGVGVGEGDGVRADEDR
jgi:hypothetical protein